MTSSTFSSVRPNPTPSFCLPSICGVVLLFLAAGLLQPALGQFPPLEADLTGVAGGAVAWADVEGDGDQDLLIVGNESGSTDDAQPSATLYENEGDGSFSPLNVGLNGVSAGTAAFGDFDDDGDPDLVIVGNEGGFSAEFLPSNSARVYENDGSGGFSEVNAGIEGVSVGAVDWGDVNDDGHLDLIVAGNVGGFGDLISLPFPLPPYTDDPDPTTRIYEGDGTGSFSPIGAGLEGVALGTAQFGDIDDDSDLDLVLTGGQGSLDDPEAFSAVYANDGSGSFTDLTAGITDLAGGSSTWVDVNGDHALDLVVTGQDAQEIPTTELYINDGGGSFSLQSAGLTGVGGGATAATDVDEDGDQDLLVSGQDDEEAPVAVVYENDGTGSFAPMTAGLTAVEGSGAAWGDVDGLGDPDLALIGRDADSTATATLYENQTDEATCPLTWSLRITATDGTGTSGTLTVGQSSDATAGLDPGCGEEEHASKPPAAPFDLRFTGTALPGVDLGAGTLLDVRPSDESTGETLSTTEHAPSVWRLEHQSSADSITYSWDASALNESLSGTPVRLVDAGTGGERVDLDMMAVDSVSISSSSVTALEVRLDPQLTRSIPLADGWSLSSVPLEVSFPAFGDVFSSCESGFVYEPGLGYQPLDDADPVPTGRGFFAHCSGDTTAVEGRALDLSAVDVEAGWNVVGAPAHPVASGAVASNPPGIVQTGFLGFDEGYEMADSLRPGQGYWVRVEQDGTLDLTGAGASSTRLAATEPNPRSAPAAAPDLRLVLRDARGQSATLWLDQDVSEGVLQRYALPPAPPGGMFDVRFASDRAAASLPRTGDEASALRTVQLQGVQYPLDVRLEGAESARQALRVLGADDRLVRLTSDTPTATLHAETNRLRVGGQVVPATFALNKSQPNPARQRATIEYAVPEETSVKIDIYDVLGRRVTRLVDTKKRPGLHSATLDASRLPSGTYFYRMEAGDFRESRRLVVLQ